MDRLCRWIKAARGQASQRVPCEDDEYQRVKDREEIERRVREAKHRLRMLEYQADVTGRSARRQNAQDPPHEE